MHKRLPPKLGTPVPRAAEILSLQLGNLLHSAGMSPPISALKGGIQPSLHYSEDKLLAQEIGRKAENIGVEMAATHFRGQVVVAGGGADARALVGHDAHPQTSAANEYSSIDHAATNHRGNLGGYVRVVGCLRIGGANLLDLVAETVG